MVVSSEAAERIDRWDGPWGFLDLRWDTTENLVVVAGSSRKTDVRLPERPAWFGDHYLGSETRRASGLWYRVEPEIHMLHEFAIRRGLAVRTEVLRSGVLGKWHQPPRDAAVPVLAVSRVEEKQVLSAWWVSHEEASPGGVEVVTGRPPLEFLDDAWPVDVLRGKLVTLVGVGSIGGAAAEVLAAYAVDHLALVDPDRLLEHNVVRHQLTARDVGRFKVNALAEGLKARHPHLSVEAHALDVIHDADVMRPLFARSDTILCGADGVEARRVVNHLARRAEVPAVFACVLKDGALGEIVRIHPGVGCLLCHRAMLVDQGAMNPEQHLDRGYGTGTRHLPMTAVGGDLATVGTLAAKSVIATLLERCGYPDQRLPDNHGVIGLRPVPGLHEPFAVERAGELRWAPIGPSRKGCPTCTPP